MASRQLTCSLLWASKGSVHMSRLWFEKGYNGMFPKLYQVTGSSWKLRWVEYCANLLSPGPSQKLRPAMGQALILANIGWTRRGGSKHKEKQGESKARSKAPKVDDFNHLCSLIKKIAAGFLSVEVFCGRSALSLPTKRCSYQNICQALPGQEKLRVSPPLHKEPRRQHDGPIVLGLNSLYLYFYCKLHGHPTPCTRLIDWIVDSLGWLFFWWDTWLAGCLHKLQNIIRFFLLTLLLKKKLKFIGVFSFSDEQKCQKFPTHRPDL